MRVASHFFIGLLAAQLSYYFFLALFPALLFLLAVASFFPLSTLPMMSAARSVRSCRRRCSH